LSLRGSPSCHCQGNALLPDKGSQLLAGSELPPYCTCWHSSQFGPFVTAPPHTRLEGAFILQSANLGHMPLRPPAVLLVASVPQSYMPSVFFGACCTDTCITPVGNATGTVKPMTRTPWHLRFVVPWVCPTRPWSVEHIDRLTPGYCASVLLSCFVSVIRRATVLPYKEISESRYSVGLSMYMTAVPLGRSARSLI
jgi:hypothetical protein